MGVSQHIGKKFQNRVVWNTNKKVKETYGQEFKVSKVTYMSWFGTAKAFANVQNGRTYAQVASQTPKYTCGTSTNRDNVKGTRIVTDSNSNSIFIAPNLYPKTDSRLTKQKQKTVIINLRHSKGQRHGEK